MSTQLKVALIVFAIICCIVIAKHNTNIRKEKISVRYSLFWLFSTFVILLVGLFPDIILYFNNFLGFEVMSNFVIGLLISLLLLITFILTIIVTKQKNQIKILIQEISLLESRK